MNLGKQGFDCVATGGVRVTKSSVNSGDLFDCITRDKLRTITPSTSKFANLGFALLISLRFCRIKVSPFENFQPN